MKFWPPRWFGPKSLPMLITLLILAVYFLAAKPKLSSTTTFQIEIIVLGLLLVLAAGALLFALVSLLGIAFSKNRVNGSNICEVK